MAREFKEKAHLKTDQKAFEEGWDRIFGKKEDKEDPFCTNCLDEGVYMVPNRGNLQQCPCGITQNNSQPRL